MDISVLAIDLAKSVFQLHGADARGVAVFKKRVKRQHLLATVVELRPGVVAMEACGGAHYWARALQSHGISVRLIAPAFVKPFVKSNKNDAADAEAICEAAQRPNMRFVQVKTLEQQQIQAIHRVRQGVIQTQTRLANQIRGLLLEYGIDVPKGIRSLLARIPTLLAENSERLTDSMAVQMFEELFAELRQIRERVKALDRRIETIHRHHPICQRLSEIPGIGPMTATALISSVGNPRMFKNGRALSAWVGLVPRQHSSGGKEQLLGISKRGSPYLRTLLIHGARSVLIRSGQQRDSAGRWMSSLVERRGINRAAVALANKNLRVAWVLMAREERYHRPSEVVA